MYFQFSIFIIFWKLIYSVEGHYTRSRHWVHWKPVELDRMFGLLAIAI